MELVAIDWFSQEDTSIKMKRDAFVKIIENLSRPNLEKTDKLLPPLSFCPVQSVTSATGDQGEQGEGETLKFTVQKKVYHVFVHVKLLVIINCYVLKELIDY